MFCNCLQSMHIQDKLQHNMFLPWWRQQVSIVEQGGISIQYLHMHWSKCNMKHNKHEDWHNFVQGFTAVCNNNCRGVDPNTIIGAGVAAAAVSGVAGTGIISWLSATGALAGDHWFHFFLSLAYKNNQLRVLELEQLELVLLELEEQL